MTKGLEALQNIKREAGIPYFSAIYDIDMWREDFATVENELKALEIIKEKNIDVRYFVDDFVKQDYGWDLYDDYSEQYHYGKDDFSRYDGEYLTEEEFNFLKEVLL